MRINKRSLVAPLEDISKTCTIITLKIKHKKETRGNTQSRPNQQGKLTSTALHLSMATQARGRVSLPQLTKPVASTRNVLRLLNNLRTPAHCLTRLNRLQQDSLSKASKLNTAAHPHLRWKQLLGSLSPLLWVPRSQSSRLPPSLLLHTWLNPKKLVTIPTFPLRLNSCSNFVFFHEPS